MVDAVGVDHDKGSSTPKADGSGQLKRTQKRKRACMLPETLGNKEMEAMIEAFRCEIVGLFAYYKEVMGQKINVNLDDCHSANAVIAAVVEESHLPLSKLLVVILERIKERARNESGSDSVTAASVKASVLSLGQRVMYGVPNPDVDVLEDDSQECLWCWETRDVKLMPKSIRGTLNIRRTCRKKIQERIVAVSATISCLQRLESDENYYHDFIKATEKLGKVFDESKIRSLVQDLSQKEAVKMAEKEAKRDEKLFAKQLEMDKREAEKEKKKMERELLKEKLRSEKEAEKAERLRKSLIKQQEEEEKNRRRREREEADMKKKLSIQKQASIMERFVKKHKSSPSSENDQSSPEVSTSKKCENVHEPLTQAMDCAFTSGAAIITGEIFKSHLSSWRHLGHSMRSNKKQRWGRRQKPKTELFKKLKLSAGRGSAHDDEMGMEKLVDGWGEQVTDCATNHTNSCCSLPDVKKCYRRKQLLQFDKSNRPAFYGIWPNKSRVVGPRCPFRKDSDLDYDIDSDEEWEEEEPGESLSDCDEDDDEECLEGCSKSEDDETEDGFFVPDGYLSENEGVQVDRIVRDTLVRESGSSPKQDAENEEFCALLQQQKYLNKLTELALRKNQPLIISNLSHEKDSLLTVDGPSGTSKLEQTCLHALTMRAFPWGSPIEISVDAMQDDREPSASQSDGKGSNTSVSATNSISESDFSLIVSTIQSSTGGINKVVESLQQKFPAISKSRLKNKVSEIADFVDNRWQVKKEILEKVGISPSPERSAKSGSIASFFSKRCSPPADKEINPNETSPCSTLKPGSVTREEQSCTYLQRPLE